MRDSKNATEDCYAGLLLTSQLEQVPRLDHGLHRHIHQVLLVKEVPKAVFD